jgi:hypothetical protein
MSDLTVLSLGAGVQSTVMALMAAHGEITPKPDVAIFADTGWEPQGVYDHLDWLTNILSNHFPVVKVQKGDIKADALESSTAGNKRGGARWASMPYFTIDSNGEKGMIRRQCTKEYKIDPIVKEIRRQLGVGYRGRVPKGTNVEQWIGISLDEWIRMKPSRLPYIEHRWPLVELEMHRHHCLRWFEKHYPGRKLAKSACIGCPYHNDAQWRELRDNSPDDWNEAVEFDNAIRNRVGVDAQVQVFIHRSGPLQDADLRTAEDMGQQGFDFGDECEGMCGV